MLYPPVSKTLSRQLSQRWRYLTIVIVVAITYVLTARLSFAALGVDLQAMPLWPPAGIALAALLLYGQQLWIGVAIGALLVALSFNVPWSLAFSACFGNALQALVGAWLLRQFTVNLALRRVQDVLKFVVLAVIITPMVNATYATIHGYWIDYIPDEKVLSSWIVFWLGDGMGILVITPVLLAWLTPDQRVQRSSQRLAKRRQALSTSWALEITLWLGLLLSMSWVVFGSKTGSAIANYPLEYLPFPFVVWAALRLSLRGTVLCSLFVSVIAIIGAAQSGGPFITKAGGDVAQAVLLLQAYISVVGVTALVLVATVAERQQSEALLMRSEASLTNAQRIARIGNWDLEVTETDEIADGTGMRWSEALYQILGYVPGNAVPDRNLFSQRVHPDDRALVDTAFQAAIHDRTPYQLDYRLLLPDGSERIVSEQVEIDPDSITGTVQDITDRKQAEAALRESEKLRTTMYRYMSQDLAEQLLQSGDAILGGDRKFVSILFSDIRGYTTLTERLEPEDVVHLLNAYFETMVDVIFDHKGTLDKFIGDAIMAVFGSPIAQDDHAQRAVQTALEMRHRLVAFNADRQAKQLSPLKVGIGINSDHVVTGNIGSSKRMEFTAIGDGVNLSSRLEGATKQYGCDIIISENTYRSCADLVIVRELDYIRVKGKTQPVSIYDLVGLQSEPISAQQQRLIDQYHQARQYYLNRDFQRAIVQFSEVLAIAPDDRATSLYLDRCHHLLHEPPPDSWDGSWQLITK